MSAPSLPMQFGNAQRAEASAPRAREGIKTPLPRRGNFRSELLTGDLPQVIPSP